MTHSALMGSRVSAGGVSRIVERIVMTWNHGVVSLMLLGTFSLLYSCLVVIATLRGKHR